MESLDTYVYNELESVLLDDRNYVTTHKRKVKDTEEIAIDSGVKLVIHPQPTQRVNGYFSHCRFTLQLTGENLESYLPVLQDAIEEILSTQYGEEDMNEEVWMTELDRENEVMGSAFGYYQAGIGEIVETTISFENGGEEEAYVTEEALEDEDLLNEQLFDWWWPQLREGEKQELVFSSEFVVEEKAD